MSVRTVLHIMRDSSDDDEDEQIVCPQSKRKKRQPRAPSRTPKPPGSARSKRDTGKPSKRSTGNCSERTLEQTTGTLPDRSTIDHSDPYSCDPIEWDVSADWVKGATANEQNDDALLQIMRQCELLRPTTTDSDSTKHVDSLIRFIMEMNDRKAVEMELLRQGVRDEVIEIRRIFASLVERMRIQSNVTDVSSSMQDVMNVRNALRGLYPHISHAHLHAGVVES